MEKMKFLLSFLLIILTCNIGFSQKNQIDAKGKKQGPWEKKHENSQVVEYKGQFKDDRPVGTFTYYYPNAKVKMVIKHNEKTGRSESYMYHDNGKLMAFGIYMAQKKDSIWTQFGPSGRISSRESYKNGLLEGKSFIYFVSEDINDKSVKVARESVYKGGKLNGEVVDYFDSGVVKKKANYLDDLRHGSVISYQPSGKMLMEENYKYGIKNGFFRAFDDNGTEIARKYYRNGSLLEGEALDKWLAECKQKGINPNK